MIYGMRYVEILQYLPRAMSEYVNFLAEQTDADVTYAPVINLSKPIEDVTRTPQHMFEYSDTPQQSDATDAGVAFDFVTNDVTRFKYFDFNPFITWPNAVSYVQGNLFGHQTVKHAAGFRELITTVYGAVITGGFGNIQTYLLGVDRTENGSDACGVFSEMQDFEGMRRMAMFGLTFLVTMYRFCIGSRRFTQNSFFKEFFNDYLAQMDIRSLRYLSALTAFPGFSRILLAYNRDNRRDNDSGNNYTINTTTSALRRLTQHINYSTKPEKRQVDDSKDILRRNVIIQELEATMNSLNKNAANDVNLAQRISNRTLYYEKFTKINLSMFLRQGYVLCRPQQKQVKSLK
jgi:hypothetical protein